MADKERPAEETRGDFLRLAKRMCFGGFERIRISVIGDIMLDRYIFGDVSRISPEAPVPIVRQVEEKSTLGGAGNVVRNLKRIGVSVDLISATGGDEGAALLRGLINAAGVDVSGVVRCDGAVTTVKTRILGGIGKQMLRIDKETHHEPNAETEAAVFAKIDRLLERGSDAVVISDYGKGFCSVQICRAIISMCRKRNVHVFVDPKGRDWSKYRGAFMVTPNIKELSDAVGRETANNDGEVLGAARELLEKYELGFVLVTRSDKGATLVCKEFFAHERCDGKEVYDVSGAGDTMISIAAALIAAGATPRESLTASNAAAQVVIQKFGTATITPDELLAALEKRVSGDSSICLPEDKIVTVKEAARLCAVWKRQGKRVVFTNGCFDILHVGHLDSLRAARKLGGRLIVGLNSDASVRGLKGKGRPVNCEKDRARMLAELRAVDLVVIFTEETPERLLSQIRPHIIAKGGDYSAGQVAGRQYAEEVVILPLTRGYSTTEIIRRADYNG